MVRISGCQFFSNKKEKKRIFADLKREFGDSVKIIFKDHYLTYSAKVERTHL